MTQSHIYLEHYIHFHRQHNNLKITQHQKHLTMLSVAYMVPPHLPSLWTPTPSPHTYSHCFTSQCIPHSNSYYLKQPYILLVLTFKLTKHFWDKSKTCSGLLISDIFLGIEFFWFFLWDKTSFLKKLYLVCPWNPGNYIAPTANSSDTTTTHYHSLTPCASIACILNHLQN